MYFILIYWEVRNEKIYYYFFIISFIYCIIYSVGYSFYYNNNSLALKSEIENLKKENIKLSQINKDFQEKNINLNAQNFNNIILKENLKNISEEKAIEIADEFLKEIFPSNYEELIFKKAKQETIEINSECLETENENAEITFHSHRHPLLNNKEKQKKVYAIYYEKPNSSINYTGYVDMNTGEILGAYVENP